MRAPNHGPTDVHDILTLTATGPIGVSPIPDSTGSVEGSSGTAGSAAA